VQANSGPVARNRAHAEICAWLVWAADRGHAASNVLDRARKGKETAKKRVLNDAELAAMMAATADGSAFSDFIRVLLHTGMRRNEASSLQPRWLDFEGRTITIPASVNKTTLDRVIPMADVIAPMLQARIEGLARNAYIFGEGSKFRSPLSGWGKPTDRLRTLMPPCDEGNGWTLHDIRRTVATRMHKAKVHPLTVEDLLGHMTGVRAGMAGVYNQAETLDDQNLAVADWAAKLASLTTNVVPFKQRVA
jgi:integrase